MQLVMYAHVCRSAGEICVVLGSLSTGAAFGNRLVVKPARLQTVLSKPFAPPRVNENKMACMMKQRLRQSSEVPQGSAMARLLSDS